MSSTLIFNAFFGQAAVTYWLWRCCCSPFAASNGLLESSSLGEMLNLKVTVTSTLRCRVTVQVTVKTPCYSLNL